MLGYISCIIFTVYRTYTQCNRTFHEIDIHYIESDHNDRLFYFLMVDTRSIQFVKWKPLIYT